jgi:hypothetical protein
VIALDDTLTALSLASASWTNFQSTFLFAKSNWCWSCSTCCCNLLIWWSICTIVSSPESPSRIDVLCFGWQIRIRHS